jgi:DNA invertase Pin-like site-specific DNA recombinase
VHSDSYLRKSTVDAGKSVARQERDWRSDCAANSFELGRAFIDPNLSASRYARKARPDYAALVAHIRSGDCQMLAMWEASRGSRDMAEWVSLLDLCRKNGVLIRIFGGVAETFDPRKPRDREALLHEGIASERESETIADRSRAGARDLAYSGKPPGPLLFGYTRTYTERGKFESQAIHPERAALVRQLAEDTLRGVSLNSQAQRLNDSGMASPQGGLWTGQGIARILRNPGYVAKRVHQGKVIDADAVWPPILTVEQHQSLCAMLTVPGRRHHTDSTLRHMLSGAALCGKCRQPLRTMHATRYLCVNRTCFGVSASAPLMERAVSVMVQARLAEPDAARIFAPPTDDDSLRSAQRELKELKEYLSGFVALATTRQLTPARLVEVERQILPQIERAEKRIRQLSLPVALAEYADLDVAQRWDSLGPAVQREFVIALADVVLSSCGKGGRWSRLRLAESRWHGDSLTWGQRWAGR